RRPDRSDLADQREEGQERQRRADDGESEEGADRRERRHLVLREQTDREIEDADHEQGQRDRAERGHVVQLARHDERCDRADATGGTQHAAVATAQRDEGGEQRHGRDEESGHSGGQRHLGMPEEEERSGHLHGPEGQHPRPVPQCRAEGPAAQGERQQEESRDQRPSRHDRGRGDRIHRHADEEVAADREARGEPRDRDLHRHQEPAQVARRRLALQIGVRGDDDLLHGAVGKPRHELGDPEVVRTDARDGADRAAEHVVQAAELPRALDRRDVLRVLDHTDQCLVAAGVATDRAAFLLRDVAADLAEADPDADLGQQLGETGDVERRRLQDVERDALRRLRADAGKAAELVDQLLDDAVVHQENLVGGS
ncbi:unnamed protein product, partial [Penicillium discolor]